MAGAFYKQKLSGEVRDLTLREIKSVLLDKECVKNGKEFRQQLILRLAGSVLPRIQEISGQDGKPINIKFDPIFNGSARKTKTSNSE